MAVAACKIATKTTLFGLLNIIVPFYKSQTLYKYTF